MSNTKHYPPQGFAKRLKDAFLESGISARQLGRMIGMSNQNIYMYFNNESCPDALILARICIALNVSADYLLFGEK